MSAELTTFRATVQDVASLAPLFDAYRVFYGQTSDLSRADKFLTDRLRADESVIFFCRESPSGPPCGFTQLYPSFSSVSAGRIWILNDLYVQPDARHRGVARALFRAAHEHARATNALRVVLATAHTNQPAQALYESLGYVRDTEFLNYSFEISQD